MKVVYTDKAPAAIGPYSQAIILNDILFTSGQIRLILLQESLQEIRFRFRLSR